MTILPSPAEHLLNWYRQNQRPLPWRDEPTPYRVWISETMLQQTRIEAARSYFVRFVQELPDVPALADVSDDRLMKLWEGLGYYSRARNLKKAAQILMRDFDGALPADYDALSSLPGIGPYTAGAVASIAFGLPYPAVDGNVLRVAARLCDYSEDVLAPSSRRELTEQVRLWLPSEAPGMFNQAIMELGETVCLPRTAPHCEQCPLYGICLGASRGTAAQLPVRSPRTARRIEKRTVFVCLSDASADRPPQVLLRKRPDTGLLAGLWELPNLPAESLTSPEDWAAQLGLSVRKIVPLPAGRHLFTHVEWQMTGLALLCRAPVPVENGVWATEAQLRKIYALPSAFRVYSRALPAWLHQNE